MRFSRAFLRNMPAQLSYKRHEQLIVRQIFGVEDVGSHDTQMMKLGEVS